MCLTSTQNLLVLRQTHLPHKKRSYLRPVLSWGIVPRRRRRWAAASWPWVPCSGGTAPLLRPDPRLAGQRRRRPPPPRCRDQRLRGPETRRRPDRWAQPRPKPWRRVAPPAALGKADSPRPRDTAPTRRARPPTVRGPPPRGCPRGRRRTATTRATPPRRRRRSWAWSTTVEAAAVVVVFYTHRQKGHSACGRRGGKKRLNRWMHRASSKWSVVTILRPQKRRPSHPRLCANKRRSLTSAQNQDGPAWALAISRTFLACAYATVDSNYPRPSHNPGRRSPSLKLTLFLQFQTKKLSNNMSLEKRNMA